MQLMKCASKQRGKSFKVSFEEATNVEIRRVRGLTRVASLSFYSKVQPDLRYCYVRNYYTIVSTV